MDELCVLLGCDKIGWDKIGWDKIGWNKIGWNKMKVGWVRHTMLERMSCKNEERRNEGKKEP